MEEDIEEAARRLSVSAKEAEAVLAKLQSLEPAGIGARSLQECILLQLQRLPNRNEQAEMLVSAHFDALRKWKTLSVETGIPLHTIQDISDDIAALHPRPGLLFARPEQDVYIEPDIFITVKMGTSQRN